MSFRLLGKLVDYFKLLGAELFSDSYKMKVVDDIFYEVEGKVRHVK